MKLHKNLDWMVADMFSIASALNHEKWKIINKMLGEYRCLMTWMPGRFVENIPGCFRHAWGVYTYSRRVLECFGDIENTQLQNNVGLIRHCQGESGGRALPETGEDYWSPHRGQQEDPDRFDFFFLSAWMGNVHAWSGHGQIGQSPTKGRHACLSLLLGTRICTTNEITSLSLGYFRVQSHAICNKREECRLLGYDTVWLL
jgi:hypothetical protein